MHYPLAPQHQSILNPAARLSLLQCESDHVTPLRTLQGLSLLLRGNIILYQLAV